VDVIGFGVSQAKGASIRRQLVVYLVTAAFMFLAPFILLSAIYAGAVSAGVATGLIKPTATATLAPTATSSPTSTATPTSSVTPTADATGTAISEATLAVMRETRESADATAAVRSAATAAARTQTAAAREAERVQTEAAEAVAAEATRVAQRYDGDFLADELYDEGINAGVEVVRQGGGYRVNVWWDLDEVLFESWAGGSTRREVTTVLKVIAEKGPPELAAVEVSASHELVDE
jgi:hypothetical protein